MARTRAFDLERALDLAVEQFWRAGYTGTSVRDLCTGMGLQPGSFYAAFGSKEACFRQALTRYLRTQGIPQAPGPEAVRAWFLAITAPRRAGKGCLLVNSAIERPHLDHETASFVGQRMDALEEFFARCLSPRPSARADAALLATTVAGIHVLSRSGASPARTRRIARHALRAAGLDAS